jgi:2-oxoglutarate/2-oxoacid ferredoxin oxidoreductase subunit alpha
MNPAALRKANCRRLEPGGTLIVNVDTFDERNLTRPATPTTRSTDGSLDGYTVYEVPMTSLTKEAARTARGEARDAERSKNFFALGLISWMYTRPVEPTLEWIEERFAGNPMVREANTAALKAGHAFGETAELFDHTYEVKPATLEPGHLHQHQRQHRAVLGAGRRRAAGELPLFLGSYPITPASDILHELSKHKNFGIRTLQAEDEIAGGGAAIGAAFGGHIGVTTTSGPGVALKARPWAWRSASSCRWSSSTSSAAGPRPGCRPRPSRPTCCWRCTAATASRRCRSSRPTARRTASTPRSRRCASRSSTARR